MRGEIALVSRRRATFMACCLGQSLGPNHLGEKHETASTIVEAHEGFL